MVIVWTVSGLEMTEGGLSTPSRLPTQRQILPATAEEQQAQCREHHLAKMMPSAVLASSRRVGSRASCF